MEEPEIVTGSQMRRQRPNLRHGYAGISWAVTIVAVVVAGLMICLPVTSAAGVGIHASATSKRFRAPYPGNASQDLGELAFGDCSYTDKVPKFPAFNLTTGVYKVSASVEARSCSISNESSFVATYGGIYPTGITFTTTNGKHTVTLHWTVHFSYNLTAGPKGAATARAWADLCDASQVLDETNGTYFESTCPGWSIPDLTSGTDSGTMTLLITSYINGTFAKGHLYEVEPTFFATVGASALMGGASASASLNLGTDGNSAKLTVVAVP